MLGVGTKLFENGNWLEKSATRIKIFKIGAKKYEITVANWFKIKTINMKIISKAKPSDRCFLVRRPLMTPAMIKDSGRVKTNVRVLPPNL